MIQNRERTPKLHPGCGNNYKQGYINTDILPVGDVIHNLEYFPYPFKSNSVEQILMENVLEHLSDIPRVMNELYEILKPGGKVIIFVPHFSHYSALFWGHKYTFHYNSFEHFDISHKWKDANYPVKQWIILKRELIFLYFCTF